MENLIPTALLLITFLPHPSPGGAQNPPAQDEAQRIKSLSRILDNGSYREKSNAILDLSWPKSEKAGKVLLRRLKRNLSGHKGAQEYPWSETSGGMTLWGTYNSENELLVSALAKQGYAEAVPTLRRMLKMKRERSGISSHNLAYWLNQLTGEPVEYEENGEKKRFPVQKPEP